MPESWLESLEAEALKDGIGLDVGEGLGADAGEAAEVAAFVGDVDVDSATASDVGAALVDAAREVDVVVSVTATGVSVAVSTLLFAVVEASDAVVEVNCKGSPSHAQPACPAAVSMQAPPWHSLSQSVELEGKSPPPVQTSSSPASQYCPSPWQVKGFLAETSKRTT